MAEAEGKVLQSSGVGGTGRRNWTERWEAGVPSGAVEGRVRGEFGGDEAGRGNCGDLE